jgi:hypothetical protein
MGIGMGLRVMGKVQAVSVDQLGLKRKGILI